MKKLLLLFFILFSTSLFPCGNEYEEIHGIDRSQDKPDQYIGGVGVSEYELYNYISAKLYTVEQMQKEASDVALAYVYLRDYKRGLQITSKLIQKYPQEYNVVINHAMCLELNGQPEQALVYMRKAIAINPDSHWGSEWIHVKILELVISKNDIQGKSVLGLDFGNDSLPVLKDTLMGVKKLLDHLEYQLEDRKFFVDKLDPLYGSLLFDFANLLYIHGEELSSRTYFEESQKYGFKHPAMLKRIGQVDKWEQITREKRAKEYADKVHNGPSKISLMERKNVLVLILSLGAIIISVLIFLRILLVKKVNP
jgi:tetratricopeptide (TPR) repeat protein